MLQRLYRRMEEFNHKPTEHMLYWISIWCVLGIGSACLLGIAIARWTGNTAILRCKMKIAFGIPCPGCGGTRALWYLLHGNLIKAVYYHAFAVYGAIWYLVFFVSQTIQRVAAKFGKQVRGMQFHMSLLYIAVAILVLQYVLKLLIPGYNV